VCLIDAGITLNIKQKRLGGNNCEDGKEIV
jgi:hypothetical protein